MATEAWLDGSRNRNPIRDHDFEGLSAPASHDHHDAVGGEVVRGDGDGRFGVRAAVLRLALCPSGLIGPGSIMAGRHMVRGAVCRARRGTGARR